MTSLNQQSKLTAKQHEDAVVQSRADRDQTLAAMHALEQALAAAAVGREEPWSRQVWAALKTLESALEDHDATGEAANSLLSDIQQMAPRLEYRVSQLHQQLTDLRRTAASFRTQLEEESDTTPDYADIRQRLAWLLTALRHYRARETDLIYEAYNVDIGQVD